MTATLAAPAPAPDLPSLRRARGAIKVAVVTLGTIEEAGTLAQAKKVARSLRCALQEVLEMEGGGWLRSPRSAGAITH